MVIFFSAGDDILLERLSNQSLISDTALAGIVLKPVLIVKSQIYILILQIWANKELEKENACIFNGVAQNNKRHTIWTQRDYSVT